MTCKGISFSRVSNLPCLRYKVTDMKLFKSSVVPGLEWTNRWAGASDFDRINQWSDTDVRIVQVTQDFTARPLTLVVRRFIPQAGDALHRKWADGKTIKRVLLPPYAIENMELAIQTYKQYINDEGTEFFHNLLDPTEKLIWDTYSMAIHTSNNALVS